MLAAAELRQLGAETCSPNRLVVFATPTLRAKASFSVCRAISLTDCIILQMLRLSPLTNTALRRTHLLLPASSAAFAAHARLLHTSQPRYLDTDRSQPSTSTYPPPSISQATRRRVDTSNNGPTASPADPTPPITPPPVEARLARRKITSVNELPERFGKNQIIAVPDQVKKELEEVMKVFKAPVRFAFAYGSGVFRQSGYTAAVSRTPLRSAWSIRCCRLTAVHLSTRAQDKPLLDFVFAVSHPSHWHAINMQQHPEHYSLPMRLLGSDAVAWMQEKGLGAGVWFNVEVEVAGKVSLDRNLDIQKSAGREDRARKLITISRLDRSSSMVRSQSMRFAETCWTGRPSTSRVGLRNP